MIDLDRLTILKGDQAQPTAEQIASGDVEACTMQLVSLLANEPWSDQPMCACPYITAFVIRWQDAITDDVRRTELMRPLIPLIIGTRGSDALMLRRMWAGIDWDMRTRTPAFLRLVPNLEEHAKVLEALPEIADQAGLAQAHEVAQTASRAAAAARDAAMDAAMDAAWAAAMGPAGDAAWAAAMDAARNRLAPLVADMQASAQALVVRLCAMKEKA